MGVGVPDVVRKNVSYLYIDGGSNDPWTTPPANDSGVVNAARLFSHLTGYYASFVLQVPNSKIIFAVGSQLYSTNILPLLKLLSFEQSIVLINSRDQYKVN